MKTTIRSALVIAVAASMLVLAADGAGQRAAHESGHTAQAWAPVDMDRLTVGLSPSAGHTGSREQQDALGPRDVVAFRALRSSATPAQRLGLTPHGDSVDVLVYARAGAEDRVASSLRTAGGDVDVTQAGVVQAALPLSSLDALTALRSSVSIARPAQLVPMSVAGEGVAATNASMWQLHGIVGTGVKVAVFDAGFGGLAEKRAAGEITNVAGTADFCEGKFDSATVHGTAVTEIVAEEAPGAQLYLACVDSVAHLAEAEAYAKANGVQIVNMSAAFFNTGRGDGTGAAGSPDAVAADARANGILWVNSAGNEAQSHWSGTFTSADGDVFNEFGPGDEVNDVAVPNGNTVCGLLRWDEWPTASDDFDLGLYDPATGTFVDSSTARQSAGGLPPTEELCVVNVSGATRFPGFVIARAAGSGTPPFDLYVLGKPYDLALEHAVAARSVPEPADSPNVLTVGADCWQTSTLEPYSSQGPTIDNRVKPDLVAPDSVSSSTYGSFTACGTSGFSGTSASSPYVAGAAALLKERYPAMRPAELAQALVATAVDLGSAGADDQYGAGKLTLEALPQARVEALAASGRFGKSLALRFRLTGMQWQLREHVHVYRGSTLIGTRMLPFARFGSGVLQTVGWTAPRTKSKPLRFCVEAWDPAGDASLTSCAAITLRR